MQIPKLTINEHYRENSITIVLKFAAEDRKLICPVANSAF